MEENKVNRLYIDASAKGLTIVLESGNKKVSAYDGKPKETLEQMFPLILSLCKKVGIAYKDMDEIYSTTGPGSTTGIRMALTQARVFYALKREASLYGAPTLDVLFLGSGLASGIAILSDRHDALFYALYENGIKVKDGHIDSLNDLEGVNNETIIYSEEDLGAKKLVQGRRSLPVPLSKALTVHEAYKKYTPDNVSDLVPVYLEKI